MSHLTKLKLKFKLPMLKRSLNILRIDFEEHSEPTKIKNYYGKYDQIAVDISCSHSTFRSDFGFTKTTNNTEEYELTIDDWEVDRNKNKIFGQDKNQNFISALSETYVTQQLQQENKYKISERIFDVTSGNIQLVIEENEFSQIGSHIK